MRLSTILTFSLTLAILSSFNQEATAQEMNLFSGRGVGEKYGLSPKQPESRWPKLKDFSMGEPPKLFNFGGTPKEERPFSKLFSGEMPKFDLFKGNSTESPMAGFSNLFPKRDPSQPGFFENLNAKSKGLMDRTSDWAARQNEGFKSKTFDTWNSITKGLNPDPRRAMENARPPARSAELPNTNSGVRRF